MTPRTGFSRTVATLVVVGAFLGGTTSALAVSRDFAARDHRFSAGYAGHAHGQASGKSASGSATMHGRGSLVGRGTLTGSGHGTFTSRSCVTFEGKAVISGPQGSLRLAARHASACAAGGGTNVSFSGKATITGGTATFAGARGRLSFRGTFDRASGAVRISLSGLIRY
jgi:hypothetical protein